MRNAKVSPIKDIFKLIHLLKTEFANYFKLLLINEDVLLKRRYINDHRRWDGSGDGKYFKKI